MITVLHVSVRNAAEKKRCFLLPYHLFDAPMIDTYINAYSDADDFRDAVIEKVMGRSEFKGVSPVDPFCGKDYI